MHKRLKIYIQFAYIVFSLCTGNRTILGKVREKKNIDGNPRKWLAGVSGFDGNVCFVSVVQRKPRAKVAGSNFLRKRMFEQKPQNFPKSLLSTSRG